MEKSIYIILFIASFNAFSQSFNEKIDILIGLPYNDNPSKINFLVNPNSVDEIEIEQYLINYDVQENENIYIPKDTLLSSTYQLLYNKGKLINNLTKKLPQEFVKPEQLERTMTYDLSGKLRKIKTIYEGYEKTVTIQKFNYTDELVERIYFTEKDTINPDNEMYKYHLDKDNYIIKEFSMIDKVIYIFQFNYNQNKDLIHSIVGDSEIKYEHIYNKSGKKIKTLITVLNRTDKSLKHTGIENFTYDPNNYLIKETTGKNSSHVIEYTYKENNLVAITSYTNGKLFSIKKYKYDDFGNWIELEYITTSFSKSPYTESIIKRKIRYN